MTAWRVETCFKNHIIFLLREIDVHRTHQLGLQQSFSDHDWTLLGLQTMESGSTESNLRTGTTSSKPLSISSVPLTLQTSLQKLVYTRTHPGETLMETKKFRSSNVRLIFMME